MKAPRLLACFLLFPLHPLSAEIARWADASLPVKDGLQLWLDASRENEAREAHFMNRLSEGQHMELWHDSSGNSRHLAQWSSNARPAWQQSAVFFDGDDYLAALLTPGLQTKDATIFIVAAPDRASGDFPSVLSTARREENDYTSGLCIDLGRDASPQGTMHYLNVEGAGQLREANLLTTPLSLEHGHLFSITTAVGGTQVRVDGKDQGKRDRGDVALKADRVAVGARFVEPAMRHFFHGKIAEVLVFARKLDDKERASVEAWLSAKHAAFLKPVDPNAPREVRLETAKDAPIVQMLVPGFEVEELPVTVTNLNNIEYAPDGRLFAGGYDGRFHLLRDTNGDGLEDKLDTFSGEISDNYPVGMVVKDGMPHALLSDEIVRFRDTNGDGVPDQRETVVKGWDDPALQKDPLLMHRRVDSAMAIAAGPDDDWYVTMGSANPGNGYWQKAEGDVWSPDAVKTGAPSYSPDKRRGCLLHITKDGKVEQLNSGLRYIMSLQWDRHGELFATDQEGATWLPNGNPFDELLHLEKGRHYGFPPRHPKLLPDVVDEPSVWDYAPQHQSTCGFRFNGPAKDRPRFGPEYWAYDAIVTGESRGKLWRTSLAKTAAGYVANNQLFASIGMLVTDCAVSPKGDLVICCHSGPPDWGRGPAHEGKLFKIRYVDPAAPRPVLTWAQDENTSVIEFDQPLKADQWQDLASRVHLEGGAFVAAGDRFEAIRPGYAVVSAQQKQPRYHIPVRSAALGKDGRSIVIESAPRTEAYGYAIALDYPRKDGGIKQADAIDVEHGLTGVQASWKGSGEEWQGWLPHPDFAVAREFTRGSEAHKAGFDCLAKQGTMKLRTKLDLSHLLQPKTQPGSKLDYTPEAEDITIMITSDAAISVKSGGAKLRNSGPSQVGFTKTIRGDAWFDLEIEVATPTKRLEITFSTAIDDRPRAFGTRRFMLPFATPPRAATAEGGIPEIAGGNRENGRALFFGKASCSYCHQMNGEGIMLGPDLSNTMHRDYAAVMRDIVDPGATINPDAVLYKVTLKNGGGALGIRVGETADEVTFALPGGNVSVVKKSDVVDTTAMPGSLMPTGLLEPLTEQEVKDLMSFLLTKPEPVK